MKMRFQKTKIMADCVLCEIWDKSLSFYNFNHNSTNSNMADCVGWDTFGPIPHLGPTHLGPWLIWAPTHLGPNSFGPRHIWAPTHLGPNTFGPQLIWAPTHLGPDSFGPQHIWAPTHLGPDPFGPRLIWAPTHFWAPRKFSNFNNLISKFQNPDSS